PAEFGEDKDDTKSWGHAAVAPGSAARVARRGRGLAGRDAAPARHGAAGRGRREHRGRAPPGRGTRRRPIVRQRGERASGQKQDRRGDRPGRDRDSAPPGGDRSAGVVTSVEPVLCDAGRLILMDQTVLPEREVERGYQRWQYVGAA